MSLVYLEMCKDKGLQKDLEGMIHDAFKVACLKDDKVYQITENAPCAVGCGFCKATMIRLPNIEQLVRLWRKSGKEGATAIWHSIANSVGGGLGVNLEENTVTVEVLVAYMGHVHGKIWVGDKFDKYQGGE